MSLLGLFISFSLLMIAVSIHEFSHAWVAYKFGDVTAKFGGRLTLNPLAHIDPLGTIVLPLLLFIATNGQFVFGAARPVPINYFALKDPKKNIIWIGLAGPLSNIVFALLLSLLSKTLSHSTLLFILLKNLILINVVLAVFNLIHLPPLDGSRILIGILPERLSVRYSRLEPYGFFLIMIFVMLGVFNLIVWPIVNLIIHFLGV